MVQKVVNLRFLNIPLKSCGKFKLLMFLHIISKELMILIYWDIIKAEWKNKWTLMY